MKRLALGVIVTIHLLPMLTQAQNAEQLLSTARIKGGLVVHVGCADGELTTGLQASNGYVVHGLDMDAQQIEAARAHIRTKGLYGPVSVALFNGKHLPYADSLVNLLILQKQENTISAGEIKRVLAPRGVALFQGDSVRTEYPGLELHPAPGLPGWSMYMQPVPGEIDEWTHHLHDAGGNAVAQDRVVGPPRHLQWTAGPLWARSHGWSPSVSAMVSSSGRVFYLCDETLNGVDQSVPDKWFLVARDAFSGVLLWKRPVPQWGSIKLNRTPGSGRVGSNGRFSMPPHVNKRLVAVGDTVYITLGAFAPITALDAATGQIKQTYRGTACADEFICTEGRLIVSINPPAFPTQIISESNTAPAPAPGKHVCALDATTGQTLWKKGPFLPVRTTKRQDPFGRLELAAGQGKAYLLTTHSIEALALDSGDAIWRIERPALPDSAVRKLGFAGMFEYLLSVMVYHDGVVLLGQPEPNTHHTYHTMPGSLYAFGAEDGRLLWQHPYGAWGHCTQPDVFVINGQVWTHVNADTEFGFVWGKGFKAKDSSVVDYRIQALDLKTGAVARELSTKDIFDVGHHHRCYRNRITERFLMSSRRGVEFVDLTTGEQQQHHWVRSGCLLGNLPCNGLLYVTPHPCSCYLEAKLVGFNALAPEQKRMKDEGERMKEEKSRLVKGPAYDKLHTSPFTLHPSKDWPTYRHDAQRSGATSAQVGPQLTLAWQTQIGTRPSSPVIARDKLIVAGVDTHTVHTLDAHDGAKLWSYTADARVDSPPTVHRNLALFGSADGSVTCLRLSDGKLAWRFRAAPQRRLVTAFDQLESAWPVPGSVLMQDGRCWFAAGRSSYLDKGLFVYALDPVTGSAEYEKVVFHGDPDSGKMTPAPDAHSIPGLLNDIPGSDGKNVFIRQLPISPVRDPKGQHLFASGGFLDPTLFNRTAWSCGWAKTVGLMVLGQDVAYGVELYNASNRDTLFEPGSDSFRLVCLPLQAPKGAAKGQQKGRQSKARYARWQQRVPIRITALIRAHKLIFAAGAPDLVDPEDPHGAWEGRKGGVLAAFAAQDGQQLAQYELTAPPVWDGLAAVSGHLYVSLTDGTVLCFTGTAPIARLQ